MKIFDIALKDLTHTFKSVFSLIMMFVAPLLIAGLLYFAFGGLTRGESNFSLPVTKVVVVNLDRPDRGDASFAAGDMLVQFLQDESLSDVLAISQVDHEAEAREAVDKRKAGVALIIPSDYTAAATTPDRTGELSIYHDPTLTIGPGIVKDLVSHFMDGFSGSKIASQTAVGMLTAHGGKADPDLAYQVVQQYAGWVQAIDHDENSSVPRLAIVSPKNDVQTSKQQAVPIGTIVAGMIIFFVFFIGANGAENIIREDEDGTLGRMLTTPTAHGSILGGKFLGVVFSLFIQIILLLLASALLFRIHWGHPVTVVMVSIGLIVAAAGFGVMLMSFIKNSRQTGPVLGGVMTLTGMLGGLFTTGIPNIPASFDKVTLVTPQGWALQGWKVALSGGGPNQALIPVFVLVGLGMVFLAVGIILFRKRFA